MKGAAVKRTLALAALCLTTALIVPSSANARVTTIRTTWVDTYFRLVDHAPLQASPTQPPSPGDVAVLHSRYSARGRTVALERTSCTIVDWPHAVCDLSIRFAAGHIVSTDQITVGSRATQRLAIVGGTGAYRNARGEIALRFTGENRGTAVFTIIT
jgi:hypothetical protein